MEDYRLRHISIPLRAAELIRVMFRLRNRIEQSSNRFRSWPFMTGRWTVMWSHNRRTAAAFGNVVVWWPAAAAALLLLLQVVVARKIHRDAHFLAIGWIASLAYFAIGTSARGVCDYQIALLFAIWALPLFIDAEASDVIGGFVSAGLTGLAAFVFVLWAPLVYAYEGFDERFLPYFAK
jgi:dolichyl-phosphate-mannose--protein O-mannosyl transferase